MPDPVTGFLVGGSVLGAGATVYGASRASRATTEAARIGAEGTQAAIDKEWEMYQQSREDFAPWREVGVNALEQLQRLTGDTTVLDELARGPGEFRPEETPGYEFGFERLIRDPYLRAQTARGKRSSGETLTGLTEYAMGYGETAYQSFLDRYYQKMTGALQLRGARLNPLQSLAGLGQSTAGGMATVASQTGSNIAGLTAAGANLQGQNVLTQGNIATGMSAGIAGVGQNALRNYMDYLMLQKMGAFPPKLMPGVGSGYA